MQKQRISDSLNHSTADRSFILCFDKNCAFIKALNEFVVEDLYIDVLVP